jgi:hypothetical protein
MRIDTKVDAGGRHNARTRKEQALHGVGCGWIGSRVL